MRGDSTLYTDLRKAVELKPQKRKKHLRRKPADLVHNWTTQTHVHTPTEVVATLAHRQTRSFCQSQRGKKTRDPLDGGSYLLRSPWWHVLLVGGEEFSYLQAEFAIHPWCCVHRTVSMKWPDTNGYARYTNIHRG